MRLEIRIDIRADGPDLRQGHGNLSMAESFDIPVAGFLDVCNILGRFQALALQIREETGQ